MHLQLRVKNIFKNFFSKSWQHQKNKFIFALTKIINNKRCYAYSHISKQRIGLVQRETILFAGHMLLLNKAEETKFTITQAPDSIVGGFLLYRFCVNVIKGRCYEMKNTI